MCQCVDVCYFLGFQEKFHQLLDIYQRLRGVAVDFISPTRDFLWEGPITKISARSGEKQSRYLFLVSGG